MVVLINGCKHNEPLLEALALNFASRVKLADKEAEAKFSKKFTTSYSKEIFLQKRKFLTF
jgi:hypothetical protein